MGEHECPICGGKMCFYGYDGLVCISCGFVGQEVTISGKLAVI